VAPLIRRTQAGEYTTPKTVLGFYAGVLAILELGVIGALTILATDEDLHHLIPWTLAFAAVTLIGLIAIVVAINVKDPTKLQLGRVTGREFLDYQRVTRGDSIGGEYVEELPPPGAAITEISPSARPAIEPPPDSAEEEPE
jgi:hypothetical protein